MSHSKFEDTSIPPSYKLQIAKEAWEKHIVFNWSNERKESNDCGGDGRGDNINFAYFKLNSCTYKHNSNTSLWKGLGNNCQWIDTFF